MKELSIEEKAKAYDNALERAIDFMNGEVHYALKKGENIMCWIFPELKDVSNDESIRNLLIGYFANLPDENYECVFNKEAKDKILAWLEKQGEHANFRNKIQIGDKVTRNEDGVLVNLSQLNRVAKKDEKQREQKPTDKVKPRFKVGDVMRTLQEAAYNITDGLPVVVSIDKEYYHCTNELIAIKGQDDYEFPPMNRRQGFDDKVEPKFHEGEWIVLWDKFYKVNYNGCGYELVDQNDLSTSLEYGTVEESAHVFTIEDAKDGDVLHSPTRHLIWIYKDNGHYHAAVNLNYADVVSFDNEIVVPSDVCPANRVQKSILFQKMEEAGYVWDAEKLELKKIDPCETCDLQTLNCQSFPCSRKQGNHPTDEEMKQLLRIEYEKGRADAITEMQKSVWSEEDEDRLDIIFERIKRGLIVDKDDIDKLKSLKERHTWKPSDEQIETLENVRKILHVNKEVYSKANNLMYNFEELIRTLKKLKV